MAYRVVCISRMIAAGAEPIGHGVADRLGFRYVDDEVIALAARHAGLEPAVLESAEHQPSLLARLMDALVMSPMRVENYLARPPKAGYYEGAVPEIAIPSHDTLRWLIQEAIAEIAQQGQAVIVAHAASLALANRRDVLRVHVTASARTRVERLWAPNKLVSEEEYAKTVAESDRARLRYLARFYDVHEESPTLYDVVLNTDALGVEQAVTAIATLATS